LTALFERLCAGLSALALFAIMALTLVDVVGRKFFSQSLTGSLELTEILMVVVIFAALPLVSLHSEHVVFESLDGWLSARWRRVQQITIDALCGAALAGVSWLMWAKAGQMMGYGDVSAQLGLPLGAFVYAMSLLCGLTALVHALRLWWPTLHQVAHPGATDNEAESQNKGAL
jgi:TRAP-type transport system small permease protein